MRHRTHRVIQMEAVECGAAALIIVLGYYGRHVSLEEAREKCGVSRDGVNALDMVKAAEWYGLKAEGYEAKLEELHQLKLPAIIYWDYNHFIDLVNIRRNGYYINDPATGPRWISKEEFKRHFSEVVLELTPGPEFEKGGEYPSIWNGIKKRMGRYKGALAYLFILQLCLVVLGLVMPVAYQIFIDKIIGKEVISWKWSFLGILFGLMCVTGLLTWIRGSFLNVLNIRLSVNFSSEFLWHILQLPINFFTQRFGGEIVQRMGLNTYVAQLLTGQLVISTISLILIMGYGYIMFQYDVLISLIGIFAGLFNLFMLFLIARIRTNAYARLKQESAKVVGVSLDAIKNIETTKLTGRDNMFFSRIAGLYTKNINATQDIGRKDVWLNSLALLSQRMSTVLLLGIGCWRVMSGFLTVGMLIGLQMILTRFLDPIGELVNFGAEIHTLDVDLSRLDDVLENKKDPLVVDRLSSQEETSKLEGFLELQNV